MEKVFLSEHIHPEAEERLRQRFEVIQGVSTAPEDIARFARGCDALLVRTARVPADVIERLPTLRAIAKHGIGVDNIDMDAAAARGIAVFNTPFASTGAVAEHTAAMILSAAQQLLPLDRMTREGGYKRRRQFVLSELGGKTIGLIGLGRIASAVVEKLKGFQVRFVACDPYVPQSHAEALGVTLVSLPQLLRESDFVSLHTPLTSETRHLIGTSALYKMKPTAWLINMSRGQVVDERALAAALLEHRIAGAALDVFEADPPADSNPLFALDNVILSPHNAALSDNALRAMALESVAGLCDFFDGHKPQHLLVPLNHSAAAD